MSKRDHYFTMSAARARFGAWWRGARVDRPPVTLYLEPQGSPEWPRSTHATLRERWLDIDFQIESVLARFAACPAMGDSVPAWFPNVGPDLVATLFGAELEFGEDTSWCQHVVHSAGDWDRFVATPPNFDGLYWTTIERMIERGVERLGDRYYVAMPDLHGNFDILSGVRGPEELCLDLLDEPERVRRAAAHATRGYLEAFRRLHHKLVTLGQPSTTWCPYLHDGPAYVPSCDFLCLVSSEIADAFIRPCIEQEMTPLERSIFHLDGPQALHHLDLVLHLPGLHAVQWVYGAGQGRATDWLHVYRRCLEAGKSIQVLAEDARDALAALEALGPNGVWLTVCSPFPNAGHAAEFLDRVHELSA